MQHQTPNPQPGPPKAATPRPGYLLPRSDRSSARGAEAGRSPETADRELLKRVLDRAPVAVCMLEGPQLTVTYGNAFFGILAGGRAVLGRPFRDALPELAGQGILELLDRVRETGEAFTGHEMTLAIDRGGHGVPDPGVFNLLIEPVARENGAVTRIICYASDVTPQVRAREDLLRAREHAERASAAKTDFLASMSHDLRTPLTAIGGYASLVAEAVYGPVTPGQADAMGRIARANAHLLALLDDVLRLAKIESGSLPLDLEPLPLGELMGAIGELIEPQVAQKGLTYECGDISGDLRVLADRDRLAQVLLNLLTNALKFTNAGGLTVECEPTEKEVLIRVRDTGPGIPAGMTQRIFDPFFQVEESGDRSGGFGLGLATSLNLARAMRGDLTVESTMGVGSVFTLRLPRA